MSPTLFDDFNDRRSIAQRFAEFDAAHPEVYAAFAMFAAQMRGRGYTHYSADGIMHIVRYHAAVNAERDGGGFKINNNFVALYARKLVAADPSFAGFFAFRIRRTA